MKKVKKRSYCGISSALDIFGDKWSLLIIRDLLLLGKKTYSDFLNSDEKIATNILADRLLLLESEGIIVKKEYPNNKAKFLYQLTPKGIDLLPVLMEIILWGDKYLDVSNIIKSFANDLRKDKKSLIEKILTDLK